MKESSIDVFRESGRWNFPAPATMETNIIDLKMENKI